MTLLMKIPRASLISRLKNGRLAQQMAMNSSRPLIATSQYVAGARETVSTLGGSIELPIFKEKSEPPKPKPKPKPIPKPSPKLVAGSFRDNAHDIHSNYLHIPT